MINIKQIANKAGVSISTVSKVINNTGSISQATRDRVKKIVDEYGYTPNSIAKSLVEGHQNKIGLIFTGIDEVGIEDHIHFDMFRAFHDVCKKYGYTPGFYILRTEEFEELNIDEFYRIHGLISTVIAGINDNSNFYDKIKKDHNIFVFDGKICEKFENQYSIIGLDNFKAAHDATMKLIDAGHRDIAVILGHENAAVTKERYNGFKHALDKSGLELRYNNIVCGNFRIEDSYEAIPSLLQNGKFSAVFSMSDVMTISLIKRARESNLTIPNDISVISFDGIATIKHFDEKIISVKMDFNCIIEDCISLFHTHGYKKYKDFHAKIETEFSYTDGCSIRRMVD